VAPESNQLPSLSTRLGLALIAPRRAFELAEAARGRAGLTDVATLLLIKYVCVEARSFIFALWTIVQVGFLPGLGALGPSLQRALGLDLIVVFGGGVLVTLAAGKKRHLSRDFDLAAVAWVPFLVFIVLAELLIVVSGARPSRLMHEAVTLVALAILAGWLGMAIRHARQRKEAPNARG